MNPGTTAMWVMRTTMNKGGAKRNDDEPIDQSQKSNSKEKPEQDQE